MGIMKTLAIAMENDILEDEKLEDVRRDGWHDSLAGTHDPLKYYGNTPNMQAYFLGHLQYHSALSEHKNMRGVKQPTIPKNVRAVQVCTCTGCTACTGAIQVCTCTGCTNEATHTWSGHPTCDECGTRTPLEKN